MILVGTFRQIDFVVEVVALELRQVSLEPGNVLTCHRVQSPSFKDVSRDEKFLCGGRELLLPHALFVPLVPFVKVVQLVLYMQFVQSFILCKWCNFVMMI